MNRGWALMSVGKIVACRENATFITNFSLSILFSHNF